MCFMTGTAAKARCCSVPSLPECAGVAVVCTGGDDPSVRENDHHHSRFSLWHTHKSNIRLKTERGIGDRI